MPVPATCAQVDEYICDQLCPSDRTLEGALARSQSSWLPALSVSRDQGEDVLAVAIGAPLILGSLIVVDNVFREGSLVDAQSLG